jgi:hypothetical protein
MEILDKRSCDRQRGVDDGELLLAIAIGKDGSNHKPAKHAKEEGNHRLAPQWISSGLEHLRIERSGSVDPRIVATSIAVVLSACAGCEDPEVAADRENPYASP